MTSEHSEFQQHRGTWPPSAGPEAPPRRRRRALVIGLSAGGLVAAITAVLVALSVTVWAELDRQDYELAASFTDTSTGFFVVIVSHTESAWLRTREGQPPDAEIEQAHAAATDFNDHMDGLSGLSAVTEDPEIAALYQEFESAYGTSRDRLLAVADAMPAMAEYFRTCHGNVFNPISEMRLGMSQADLDRVLADYDHSRVACTEALQAIADGEHEWSREHAEAQLELWPPLRDATEQVGRAAMADDRAAIDEATEVRTAATDELGNAQAEFENDFRSLSEERPSTESSDALLAALAARAQES